MSGALSKIACSLKDHDHATEIEFNCAPFFVKAHEAGVLSSIIESLEVNAFTDCEYVEKIAISFLGDDYDTPEYAAVRQFLDDASVTQAGVFDMDVRIDYDDVCAWLEANAVEGIDI